MIDPWSKYKKIPDLLISIPRWRICSKDKRPLNSKGFADRSEESLYCFDDACRLLQEVPEAWGLALEFGHPGICGVDLDGCRDPISGQVSDWAREIIKRFDSYTEVSQSGEGVKIWFYDEREGKYEQPWTQFQPEEARRIGKAPGIEVYLGGKRYFCVTGQRLRGHTKVNDSSEAVDWIFDRYKKESPKPARPVNQYRLSNAGNYSAALERCRNVVAKVPGSSKGDRDSTLWRVALICHGFDLDIEDMRAIMWEWNDRCDPPQPNIERRIDHKIRQLARSKQEPGRFLNDQYISSDDILGVIDEQDAPFTYHRKSTMIAALGNQLQSGAFDMQSTGLMSLDEQLGGGMPANGIAAIMGRPSHGKTAFILHCLKRLSLQGKKCMFITKEMSVMELMARMIQSVEASPRSEWKYNHRSIIDKLAYEKDSDNLIYVDDCRDLDDIEICIRHAVGAEKVGVVAVDYLQRIPVKGAESEYERVSQCSLRLSNLARELGVTLYLAVQMNRMREQDKKRRGATMSDARGSGQVEQDVDLMVHVEWPHLIASTSDPHDYNISIIKSRFGVSGYRDFTIRWDPDSQIFEPDYEIENTIPEESSESEAEWEGPSDNRLFSM